ncbi:NmrA-like family protein [Aspergillus novofumigatus IBT 16806]|uniref:NmrA-like family protein n=1 Tax=Aspergillus novofumigatus (strain IBT 16806) TaxID=1392255 RepID=A0A2I1BWC3_ASPN1|nr:NmrA-like family protein [Aspergillus novofumigatus IBT 16806]PKX89656.1 NmrA-like family protein [Aspergillus novofumigatus IBT 16806]
MFPIQNITVLGASGAVGTLLVNALLASNFTISVVLRPSSSATFSASVTIHHTNYNNLAALTTAFQGQHAIISAIGTFNAAIQRTAINTAATMPSVRQFIPSKYRGDTSQLGGAKCEIMAIYTGLVLTLTIMQLLELENAAIGWDLSVHWVSVFDLCNQPFVMSTLRQVMRVIISVLQHEEEARNAYVYIKLFQQWSGTKFKVRHLITEDIMPAGVDHLKQGDYKRGYLEVVTANGVLGLPEENLEETVRDVLREKGLLRSDVS